MLHAPKSGTGLIVSGGTEGNITAMWLAKQLSGKKEIILPKSAHFSFAKIASLMDLKLVEAPLTRSTLSATLRRSALSQANHTSPMPPLPSGACSR